MIRTLEGSPLKKLFAHILQQPGDPRFAAMLNEFYEQRQGLLVGPAMMSAFAAAIIPHADSRHIRLLTRVADTSVKARKQSGPILARLRDETPKWLKTRLAKMPKRVRDRSHEDALWSAVYAKPKELTARAVLADALIERGDPRGDFIAAQLAGDTTVPSAELLRSLLGPLFSALRPDTVKFENGFPVSGVMNTKLTGRQQSASFLLREWITFKSLKYVERLGPSLVSLERVEHIDTLALREWSKTRWPIPLRDVTTIHSDALPLIAKLPSPIEHFSVSLWLKNAAAFETALESLENADALTSLQISSANFFSRGVWTSDAPFAWPMWSDRLLAVPRLTTLDVVSAEGRWVFTSKNERFDTLTLYRRGEKSTDFEKRALKLAKFVSVHADDLT